MEVACPHTIMLHATRATLCSVVVQHDCPVAPFAGFAGFIASVPHMHECVGAAAATHMQGLRDALPGAHAGGQPTRGRQLEERHRGACARHPAARRARRKAAPAQGAPGRRGRLRHALLGFSLSSSTPSCMLWSCNRSAIGVDASCNAALRHTLVSRSHVQSKHAHCIVSVMYLSCICHAKSFSAWVSCPAGRRNTCNRYEALLMSWNIRLQRWRRSTCAPAWTS